jgi:hypothetical protein
MWDMRYEIWDERRATNRQEVPHHRSFLGEEVQKGKAQGTGPVLASSRQQAAGSEQQKNNSVYILKHSMLCYALCLDPKDQVFDVE